MKKVLKWFGIAISGFAGIIGVMILAAFVTGNSRINRIYELPAESIDVDTDPESITNGEHLVQIFCADCHGENLGGTVFLDDPMLGTVMAPNLTGGAGGVGQTYSDLDFERAIRHGVDADGKGLWIMPANDYAHFSNEDVADIIAYLRSVDPVNNQLGESQLGTGGRVLFMLGAVSLLPAQEIDHNQPHVETIEPGVNVVYGEYLARTCTGCHGPDYADGPGSAPGDPPAANLTPDKTSGLGTWTEADFIRAIRTGTRPDGTQLAPAMPWQSYSPMTDDELSAIWLFLESLPPVEADGQ